MTLSKLQKRILGVLAAMAIFASIGLSVTDEADAVANDQWCNWGEVCLADWHAGGWQIWSEPSDVWSYWGLTYAATGFDLNNRSNVALNAGMFCPVTLYSGMGQWGNEVTVHNNATWFALDGNVGIDQVSSHDFCA